MSGEREPLERLLYESVRDACSGYVDNVPEGEPVEGGAVVDGDVDFGAVAAAVRAAGAEHRARMRELTGKTPFGAGAGYLASEDADEVDLFDASVEEWLATLNEILRRTKGELEALERASDGSMFGLYRVRMTGHGAGPAETIDREMRAVPRVGDYVNAASGELVVDEVHWNFDPRIPCDVILFMVSPPECD